MEKEESYGDLINGLEQVLTHIFKNRWKLEDGSGDPLMRVLNVNQSADPLDFGDFAARFVGESFDGLCGDKKLRENVDKVVKLGTLLSMRSTDSRTLSNDQKAASVMPLPVEEDRERLYTTDPRTQRMVVLCACWIALYFLGLRFDYFLSAIKRLADRSQGYPNGFVSIVMLAECVEDYRYDVTEQSATDPMYLVAMGFPVLFAAWKEQPICDRSNFKWYQVAADSQNRRDWLRFTEYIGWLYYYWQSALLGSALANLYAKNDGIKLHYFVDLTRQAFGDLGYKGVIREPYEESQRVHRLNKIYPPQFLKIHQLDRSQYFAGVFHGRGGFAIGTREGFGMSNDVVARRLEGPVLQGELDRLARSVSL